jgi:hypothetical protein
MAASNAPTDMSLTVGFASTLPRLPAAKHRAAAGG